MRSDRMPRLVAAAALWLAATTAATAMEVFTCEPEWAALLRVLAPDARVTSATHALQDPHHIEARPALIAALRRARLAVCTGASLEVGWLPMLQQRAGNPAIHDGRDGMFYAYRSVELIDAQVESTDTTDESTDAGVRPMRTLAQPDLRSGDVHAEGNPHFHLDPGRLRQVAQALAERLAAIDPAQADAYRARYRTWAADWDRRAEGWKARAAPLKGRAVVAQHAGFAYLWRWLGIEQVADLEPKPGLPPTISQLQRVLRQVGDQPPRAVVQALHHDPQAGRWLVDRIGVPLLVLPATVTPDGPAATLEGLYELLLDELLRAAGGEPRR